MNRRRPALLLAAVPAALLLAGCAADGTPTLADNALYLATTGEMPARAGIYRDITGMERIGRPPPQPPGNRFRPAADPGAGDGDREVTVASGALATALADYARLRQSLSDRDDEYALDRRALADHLREYIAATAALRWQPGDPLPAEGTERTPALYDMDMVAARAALGNVQADAARINATVLRLQPLIRATGAQIRRAQALATDRTLTEADTAVATALVGALEKSLATARAFEKSADQYLGRLIEYAGTQRRGLDRLDEQVHGTGRARRIAGGPG